jgi:NAD(P)-dependent dehydrogenase (short-subunit alcohol dehydrogenase family)
MPVAVITGASAGIGRATARAFAAAGYDLALLARGRAGLDETALEVASRGVRPLAVPTDVADWEAVRTAAQRAEDELGPVDVWVNNAMSTVFSPVSSLTAAELHRATAVTYFGQVHGTMAALELMRPRDRGTIVSVGSALAYRAIPLQAAYCGAKFATRGFLESLRTELIHDGSNIRLTEVHLPGVNTPQFDWCRNHLPNRPRPVEPVYQPELCAEAILAAARADRPPRHRIVGTWNWLLVQGNKVMPGVFDHYAARTAVEGQQTDEAAGEGGDNLYDPVDDRPESARAARGRFDELTGGLRNPQFLASLPTVALDLGGAAVERAREALASR